MLRCLFSAIEILFSDFFLGEIFWKNPFLSVKIELIQKNQGWAK
jgi:hypothetical protein